MRLIKSNTSIDFIGKGRYAVIVSAIVLLVSCVSLGIGKLSFGIDFTGGVVVHVQYPHEVSLNKVRSALSAAGYAQPTVQHFGSAETALIRLPAAAGKKKAASVGDKVMNALKSGPPGAKLQSVEFVGPQVGSELVNKGALALLYTVIAILVYVIFRFHWKLATGAVAALVHDIVITLGVFSLTRMNFDLTVLAALLAVLGYSLNDTIVVYDRIRENFRRMRKATPKEVANAAINQTLARTLMTSGTTLMTLLALFFLGGPVIHGFAAALLVGIITGTYSSIFVASTLALYFKLSAQDLFPPKEEDAAKAAKVTR